MKLKVNRSHFNSGLQQVPQVVKGQPGMPILSHVLLEAKEEGVLSLSTTNLDVGIRCHIQAEVSTPGQITLPVHRLCAIAKELPHSDVFIETRGTDQVKLTSGGATFHIVGMPADQFPEMPVLDTSPSLTLSQNVLLRMLKSVSYAQSNDENRYVLNGVYFDIQEKGLKLVATDGRRLATIEHTVDEEGLQIEPGLSREMILPSKTVSELERLLGKGEQVKMRATPRQAMFEIQVGPEAQEKGFKNEVLLFSKLIEGKYPNYNQVIPKETLHHISVERGLLQECIHRAALVVTDKSYSIKMRFHNNLLEIMGSSPQFGQSHESMAIQYEGPDLQLTFNPAFLMDPLKALTRDELFFEFKDEQSPGVFRTQDRFLCVVMPLRIT